MITFENNELKLVWSQNLSFHLQSHSRITLKSLQKSKHTNERKMLKKASKKKNTVLKLWMEQDE